MELGDLVVREILKERAEPWILEKHYAGRMPSISRCFGLIDDDDELHGVCTYGLPASPFPRRGICGEEFEDVVIELNRLVIRDGMPKNTGSYFVSKTLQGLTPPKIVLSYADRSRGHVGYVYQASNFLYVGLTDSHVRWEVEGQEGHSRHAFDEYGGVNAAKEADVEMTRTERPRKHRYVYFVGGSSFCERARGALRYEVQDYPKGDTERHNLSVSMDGVDDRRDWGKLRSIKEWQKFKGVGPKTAQALMDELGPVEEANMERLENVNGVGPKTAELIRAAVRAS